MLTGPSASTTLRITETTNGDSNAGWIDDVSVEEVAPTVFGSGISAVTAWDPIFPATAYPNAAALSTPTQTVGPLPNDPRWTNPHAASVFPKNTHIWENTPPMNFNANWINAWSNIASQGPGGQSWTKYSTTVTGEGSFVLQFLADNVSWIYLDGALVGYQDWNWQSVGTGRYTINLTGTGPHELVFIIWDGGGAAGGKFRIETLQSFVSNGGGTPPPPPPPPPPSDKTAPVITAPVGITQEATSAAGAVATFTATAIDNTDGSVPVVASPASGSTFAIGTTAVGLAAADKAGNTATASFNVTVRDTTKPVVTVPANFTVEATGATGATASYAAATATDAVGVTSLTSLPASGTTFALGSTTVTATAKDAAGNTGTASFTITVRDTTAPVITTTSANITTEATSAAGTAVTYTAAAATDAVGPVSIAYSQASGTVFPLGTATVTVTATDGANNAALSKSFTVTVVDTTAPAITVPASITAEATGATGATVSYPVASATDAVGVTALTYSQASGTLFPLGTTTVTVTAKDAAGNTGTKSFTVTVRDTTAPGITATMTPRGGGDDESAQFFTLAFSATDAVGVKTLTAVLNGVTVTNGQVVQLQTIKSGAQSVKRDDGKLQIKATAFSLVVTATDATGNKSTKTIVPVFVKNGKDDDKKDDDKDDKGKDK